MTLHATGRVPSRRGAAFTRSSPPARGAQARCRPMRLLSALSITAGFAAAAASPAQASPLADPVEAGRYTFDRSLVLPTPALSPASPIVAAGGLREGGLSALQVIPGTGNRRFLSVSDRGPNGQPPAARGGGGGPAPGPAAA